MLRESNKSRARSLPVRVHGIGRKCSRKASPREHGCGGPPPRTSLSPFSFSLIVQSACESQLSFLYQFSYQESLARGHEEDRSRRCWIPNGHGLRSALPPSTTKGRVCQDAQPPRGVRAEIGAGAKRRPPLDVTTTLMTTGGGGELQHTGTSSSWRWQTLLVADYWWGARLVQDSWSRAKSLGPLLNWLRRVAAMGAHDQRRSECGQLLQADF